MMDYINYAYDRTLRLVGRPIKHTLLLHENDLNALYLGALIRQLKDENWRIISPEEAYTDTEALATTYEADVRKIIRDKKLDISTFPNHKGFSLAYLDKLFDDAQITMSPLFVVLRRIFGVRTMLDKQFDWLLSQTKPFFIQPRFICHKKNFKK